MEHPITPPPQLRQLWAQQAQRMDPRDPVAWQEHVANQAARWGADTELKECCEWLRKDDDAYQLVGLRAVYLDHNLRAARRPQPPSLKKQALAVVENALFCDHLSSQDEAILRRALEGLPE